MLKLFVNPITHLVTGYEILSEYSTRYMDDIILSDEESFKFKFKLGETYYEDGKVIYDENRDTYHKKMLHLKEELSKIPNKTKSELLNEFILNFDLTNIIGLKAKVEEEYNKILAKREEFEIQINEMKTKHKESVENYYKELSKRKDDEVNALYKSSICLLAKDEDLYLEEWMNHHMSLGFEHIYIYDNGSKTPIREFVQEHFDETIKDKITVIDFSEEKENIQSDCYNDFLKNHKSETRWCAFIDTDEFITLGDEYGNINQFLDTHQEETAIYIDFVEYGADGREKYSPEPVRERFTTPVKVRGNYARKVIVKPYKIDRFKTHYPVFDAKINKTLFPEKEEIMTHHYYTKSFEEWQKKMERGSCDPNWMRNFMEFFVYNPDMKYLDTGDKSFQVYQKKE